MDFFPGHSNDILPHMRYIYFGLLRKFNGGMYAVTLHLGVTTLEKCMINFFYVLKVCDSMHQTGGSFCSDQNMHQSRISHV